MRKLIVWDWESNIWRLYSEKILDSEVIRCCYNIAVSSLTSHLVQPDIGGQHLIFFILEQKSND